MRSQHTRELAGFAAELRYSDLPSAVVAKAKEIALHGWAVQLAGSTLPWANTVERFVRREGGSPRCTVVNFGYRTSATNAVFANGTFGHSFEMDDNHAPTGIKGGCVVLPAVLAVGEQQESSGEDLILAIVAAYEVMIRIGLSVTPALMARGHQATGSCGPFGAAVAVGKLLQFDQRAMLHALSIAAAHSSGLLESPASGRGDLKRIYGGMAAANGVRAALLAGDGLTGPATMLEGELGFCRAFGDLSNLSRLTAELGARWHILDVHYKLYAQDGYIQPMTEALERILKQHPIDPADIEEIRAGCSEHAHEQVVGVIREPRDLTSAQFSANFSLALYLVKGGAGFSDYTEEALSDPRIIDLSRRIHTAVDAEIEDEWRRTKPRGARVTVRLTSGETHTECVPMLRAMTPKDVDDKARQLANVVLNAAQTERLIDTVRNLENVKNASTLIPLLVREP